MCVNGGPVLAKRGGGVNQGEGAWKAEGSTPRGDACKEGEGLHEKGVAGEWPFHTNGAVGVHQQGVGGANWGGGRNGGGLCANDGTCKHPFHENKVVGRGQRGWIERGPGDM